MWVGAWRSRAATARAVVSGRPPRVRWSACPGMRSGPNVPLERMLSEHMFQCQAFPSMCSTCGVALRRGRLPRTGPNESTLTGDGTGAGDQAHVADAEGRAAPVTKGRNALPFDGRGASQGMGRGASCLAVRWGDARSGSIAGRRSTSWRYEGRAAPTGAREGLPCTDDWSGSPGTDGSLLATGTDGAFGSPLSGMRNG